MRNPDFPANYIAHINETPGPILASTHDTVLAALASAKVPFILCYPSRECLEEYVGRYIDRGSAPKFIDLIRENWDAWLEALEKNQAATWHIVLGPGEYLSDYARNT